MYFWKGILKLWIENKGKKHTQKSTLFGQGNLHVLTIAKIIPKAAQV